MSRREIAAWAVSAVGLVAAWAGWVQTWALFGENPDADEIGRAKALGATGVLLLPTSLLVRWRVRRSGASAAGAVVLAILGLGWYAFVIANTP